MLARLDLVFVLVLAGCSLDDEFTFVAYVHQEQGVTVTLVGHESEATLEAHFASYDVAKDSDPVVATITRGDATKTSSVIPGYCDSLSNKLSLPLGTVTREEVGFRVSADLSLIPVDLLCIGSERTLGQGD